MKKIITTYVEKIYRGVICSESVIRETDNRHPLSIENDGDIQGFRFYDKERLVVNNKEYYGDTINYSPWYFFGERLSLDDIKSNSNINPIYKRLIPFMEHNKINYVCHTQVGSYLPMEDEDMTIDEYKKSMGYSIIMDK